MPTANDGWIKRNATNLFVGLLTSAIIGTVIYVQNMAKEIVSLRHDYDVQVERRDKEIQELRNEQGSFDLRLGDQDKDIDNNRERIIHLEDWRDYKK